MARNEKSSPKMGTLASKAMTNPKSLTPGQIKSLGASVMTQRPDHKPAPKASSKRGR